MQTINEAAKIYAEDVCGETYCECYSEGYESTKGEITETDFKAGVEFAQRWIPVEEDLPSCYENGNWDGLRSDFCLVKFEDESIDIARMYKGTMDGFEFQDWYDKIDFDFGSSIITHWRPIEYPIL